MDRKEYFRNRYKRIAEEEKQKRRERYAMQKNAGSRFGEADKELENKMNEDTLKRAKSIAQKVFKRERLFEFNCKGAENFPDEISVVVMNDPFFCRNLIIPPEVVDKNKSWIAVFTESLNEICFVNCKNIKQYYQGALTECSACYAVPVNESRWFEC